jgi:hypothetical protein
MKADVVGLFRVLTILALRHSVLQYGKIRPTPRVALVALGFILSAPYKTTKLVTHNTVTQRPRQISLCFA